MGSSFFAREREGKVNFSLAPVCSEKDTFEGTSMRKQGSALDSGAK